MDTSNIELKGSEVEAVRVEGDTISVCFSKAYIIKSMTGSKERTRWWQIGELVFEGAEIEGEIAEMPSICDGGDVGENIYTYRDMIPIPLESRGRAHCDLRFKGSDRHLRVRATAVTLKMADRPYYIEHIRDN